MCNVMNDSFQYGDIIFLGIIAVFVLLRLRSMLGRNSGIDPHELWKNAARDLYQGKTMTFSEQMEKKPVTEEIPPAVDNNVTISSGLKAIKSADASFSVTDFLAGAKIAFEWVVEAFSKGDKDKLQKLLSSERFKHFAEEIDARAQEEERRETTLVSIVETDITEANIKDSTAQITVQFTTEQINVIRNKEGAVTGGNASQIEKAVDVWTFERDVSSRDPNWKIIAT